MPNEIERRLAKLEEAVGVPKDPDADLDDALALWGLTREELAAWEIPDNPDASLSTKLLDWEIYQITGCHRPYGPDPVTTPPRRHRATGAKGRATER